MQPASRASATISTRPARRPARKPRPARSVRTSPSWPSSGRTSTPRRAPRRARAPRRSVLRHHDLDLGVEVAGLPPGSAGPGRAAAAGGRSTSPAGTVTLRRPPGVSHRDRGAERRLPRRHRQVDVDVAARRRGSAGAARSAPRRYRSPDGPPSLPRPPWPASRMRCPSVTPRGMLTSIVRGRRPSVIRALAAAVGLLERELELGLLVGAPRRERSKPSRRGVPPNRPPNRSSKKSPKSSPPKSKRTPSRRRTRRRRALGRPPGRRGSRRRPGPRASRRRAGRSARRLSGSRQHVVGLGDLLEAVFGAPASLLTSGWYLRASLR